MISLHNVSVRYKDRVALRVDRLTLAAGEVTVVIGRNGSGKSTLLRALAGVIGYEGSIRLAGDELRALSHRERARRLAYLPQTLGCPSMSVQTLVGHGRFARLGPLRALSARDREAVRQAMERTDTWELRHRLLADLSGGERQRAYLAMVIAQDTPMLLLDEPGAHLDVTHRLEVARILRELAESGRGVVVTSHDLPEAFAIASTTCVIKSGTMEASRPAGSVAADESLLTETMGVCVRRVDGEGLLYPYALADGTRTTEADGA